MFKDATALSDFKKHKAAAALASNAASGGAGGNRPITPRQVVAFCHFSCPKTIILKGEAPYNYYQTLLRTHQAKIQANKEAYEDTYSFIETDTWFAPPTSASACRLARPRPLPAWRRLEVRA